MRPFHQQAEALGTRSRAVSFAVNSAWLVGQLPLPQEEAERLLVMGYVPRKGGLQLAGERNEDLHLFRIRVLIG
jgi:hypothetical protein